MKKHDHLFNAQSCWAGFFATILATSALAKPGQLVVVPAGSTDALEDAIAEAGPDGTVLLESGAHSESSRVVVDIPVSIIGEEGAVLEVIKIGFGLHILDTEDVLVEGVSFFPPAGERGDVGILIQDSPHVIIRNNAFAGLETGIFVHGGDHVEIAGNVFTDIARWGFIHVNGAHARVTGNVMDGISNGMFLCSTKGQCYDNAISNTGVGILLCRFGDGWVVWPDGSSDGAAQPATQWHVANNKIEHTAIGILPTDGAYRNLINNNEISSSADVDILLEGEFIDEDGVFYPAAIENTVTLGKYKNVTVWDFGIDNKINGVKK